MNNRLEDLSLLLGEYWDSEGEIYRLVQEKISTTGIKLQFNPLKTINHNKVNPTWSDLIQELTSVYYGGYYQQARCITQKPILVDGETYKIELILPSQTILLGEKTFADWRIRLNIVSQVKDNTNFVTNLPFEISNFIEQNSFQLRLTQTKMDPSGHRQKLEETLFLNTPIQKYVDKLFQKLLVEINTEVCKMGRLELLGLDFKNFKSEAELVRNYLKTQPFTGFGVKNIVHLRFIVDNLKSGEFSNEDLLTVLPPVQLQLELLNHLKTCMTLDIPYSAP